MKTFTIRSISGAIYAAIILGSIFSGPVVFGFLVFIILLIGLVEYHGIVRNIGAPPSKAILVGSSTIMYLIGYLILMNVLPPLAAAAILFTLLVTLVVQFFMQPAQAVRKTGLMLLGMIYLVPSLFSLNLLYYSDFHFEDRDPFILLGLFFITWINDTFAYITGSLIGKHKLAEQISPHKTIEGTLGGFVFSMAGGYGFSLLAPGYSTLEWLIMALIIVIFGTFGDLFESILKRNGSMKESGNLIPGHGGILDRIDSILMAGPVAFLYVYFILN